LKPATLIGALLVLAGTAVCARLGFWQISRLHEKQAANAAMRAALAAPPVDIERMTPIAAVAERRVTLHGRFVASPQVLLAARANGGSPGVAVVTPFRLAGDSSIVLVDRGWLYASDAATARPQDYPEPGRDAVTGLAHAIPAGQPGHPWRRLPGDSTVLWSALALDRDSLAAHIGGPLAGFSVRELPGPGVPNMPRRSEPRPLDEFMHVSYATQWFLFGAILLFGSFFLARSRGRRSDGVPPAPGA